MFNSTFEKSIGNDSFERMRKTTRMEREREREQGKRERERKRKSNVKGRNTIKAKNEWQKLAIRADGYEENLPRMEELSTAGERMEGVSNEERGKR